jgi:simple sugar transport system substrate-binding protein
MVELAPYNEEAMPADVIADAQATAIGIANGSIVPFAGPILGQDGAERVAEGASLSDGDLLGMNWYVQGIEGQLPN